MIVKVEFVGVAVTAALATLLEVMVVPATRQRKLTGGVPLAADVNATVALRTAVSLAGCRA